LRRGLAAALFAAVRFGERGARDFAGDAFEAFGAAGAFDAALADVLRAAAFFTAAGCSSGVSDGGSDEGAGLLEIVGFFLDKTF
jgi:hypothetical protein